MSDFSERISALSPAKRALLERRLQGHPAEPEPHIPHRAGSGPFPVSFAQQRLWFLEMLTPNTPLHSVCRAVGFRGPLDVGVLREAIACVVARHEALRTSFPAAMGVPYQDIHAPGPVEMQVMDLTSLTPAERELRIDQLIREARLEPFDLERGPLLRACLIRTAEQEYVFVLTVHHIVFDGWSLGVLFEELAACYQALSSGSAPQRPGLPLQYADYAVWQRDYLQGQALERELHYWREQLGTDLPALDLPTDRPRPPEVTWEGADANLTLPAALWDEVQAASRREGVTPFMLLLAVYGMLLSRYTRQEQVIIGVPVANRDHVELEPLIGFFVNMLPMRLDLGDRPSFRELLARVREVAVGAYSHAELPFEALVEALQVPRDRGRTPVFEVACQLLEFRHPAELVPGIAQVPRADKVAVANFALNLEFFPSQQGLRCRLTYQTALFDAETARRMLGHFEVLLRAALASPEQAVQRLPILTEDERRQILGEWKGHTTSYPRTRTVHELFAEQAQLRPDACAARYADRELSYRDLNRRANSIARALGEMGVGGGSLVGVLMESSPEMLSALIGILETGAAYVPLDPSYPGERLRAMLEDSGVAVVVVQPTTRAALPDGDWPMLSIDETWTGPDGQGEEPLTAELTADSPAYVMYTSGSTGKPKGVVVPHRAIVRLVCGSDYITFGPADVVPQIANCSFDAASFEIWGALLNGAQVVGLPGNVVLSPPEFAVALRETGSTAAFLTSALFSQTVAEEPAAFASLDTLIVGGDVVDPRRAREALAAGPPRRLLNGYGPTENATFTTWHPIAAIEPDARSVPIGRPLANTTVYVLDPELAPVPVGVPGELCAGGDGLALGYWNRPDLTAERFVDNPFGEGKLYRTGDLARFLPNGTIEFLGRLDEQIKVRGFRIEPGEIEAALREHPAVRDAVVSGHRYPQGDVRLIAYVTLSGECHDEVDALRRYLRATLPDYMVPAAVIPLDALPVNANGKVDRSALPPPGAATSQSADMVGPRDPLERRLAQIWEEVLGHGPVDVRESFFDIGGHSLLAVRLFARMRTVLGCHLPVSALFEAPSIEAMARLLRESGEPSPWPCLIPMQAEGPGAPVFIIPPLNGDILGFYQLARLLGPEHPVYGLEARGLDGHSQPLSSVEEIAANYIGEILAERPQGPWVLAGYSSGGIVAFEMARQLRQQGTPDLLLAVLDVPPMPATPAERALSLRRWLRLLRGWSTTASRFLRGEPERPDDQPSHSARRLRHPRPDAPDADLERYLAERFRGWHDVPAERYPMMIAHYRALGNYRPQPCPGTAAVFYTEETRRAFRLRRALGWPSLLQGKVELIAIPGDHHSLYKDPHVEALARALRQWMDAQPTDAPR